jgi:hypothetical protein
MLDRKLARWGILELALGPIDISTSVTGRASPCRHDSIISSAPSFPAMAITAKLGRGLDWSEILFIDPRYTERIVIRGCKVEGRPKRKSRLDIVTLSDL